jgi:hypothetical protein
MRRLIGGCAYILLLAACTTTSDPTPGGVIVDTKGINMAQYQDDLRECGYYADEVRTGEKVATHAAGGAVVWGAVGAIWGRGNTAESAASGAVVGGAHGVHESIRERQRVIKNCLRYRGYKVLN